MILRVDLVGSHGRWKRQYPSYHKMVAARWRHDMNNIPCYTVLWRLGVLTRPPTPELGLGFHEAAK
jgi:hypothetical protein